MASVQLYYYKGKWSITSEFDPDCSHQFLSWDEEVSSTLKDSFWSLWSRLSYQLPSDTSYCYEFYFVSPLHRFVTKYTEDIVLHSVYDLKSNCQLDPQPIAELNEWHSVASVPTPPSLDHLLDISSQVGPFKLKGFVFLNLKTFQRFYVTTSEHVAATCQLACTNTGPLNLHAKWSEQEMIILARSLDAQSKEELLTYFPLHKDLFTKASTNLAKLVQHIDAFYKDVLTSVTQEYSTEEERKKEIGKRIQAQWFNYILFRIRSGLYDSVQEYIALVDADSLLSTISKFIK